MFNVIGPVTYGSCDVYWHVYSALFTNYENPLLMLTFVGLVNKNIVMKTDFLVT